MRAEEHKLPLLMGSAQFSLSWHGCVVVALSQHVVAESVQIASVTLQSSCLC